MIFFPPAVPPIKALIKRKKKRRVDEVLSSDETSLESVYRISCVVARRFRHQAGTRATKNLWGSFCSSKGQL